MAEHEHFSLPHVDDIDFARILPEDITDPTHIERWRRLSDSNPELARAILHRAIEITYSADSRHDHLKGAIDLSTFVIEAIASALERQHTDSEDYA